MVYDVEVGRVNKVLKIARKYLNWIQNSVLEGEISNANFTKLKFEISRTIKPNKDSVLFYVMRTRRCIRTEVLGVERGKEEMII